MADRILLVHPDRLEEVRSELKRRGVQVVEHPNNPQAFIEELTKAVPLRWASTEWPFDAPDSAIDALYESTLISYVTGNNIAAVMGGLAVIEGLLRTSIYHACRSTELPEGKLDVETEEKLSSLTLYNLAEKARKLGLIREENELWIKKQLVPVRNAIQHGNARQMARELVGDNVFNGEEVDLSTWETKKSAKSIKDFAALAGPVFREVCKQLAVDVLIACSSLSIHLRDVMRGDKYKSNAE